MVGINIKKTINTTLSWQDSLDLLKGKTKLTLSGAKVAQRIIETGRIFMHKFSRSSKPIPVIDVHCFLNHRVEPELMELIGIDLAEVLKPYRTQLLITAAVSGVAVAQSIAHHLRDIPYIYARKEVPITFSSGQFKSRSYSFTGDHPIDLFVSRKCLRPQTRVIIIDDFLYSARTLKDLLNIITQARAKLKAVAFVIEVAADRNQNNLAKINFPIKKIHSLLKIVQLKPGEIQISGIPYWLSLKSKIKIK